MHEGSRQRVVITAEIATMMQSEPFESHNHALSRRPDSRAAKKYPGETHVIVMTKALVWERQQRDHRHQLIIGKITSAGYLLEFFVWRQVLDLAAWTSKIKSSSGELCMDCVIHRASGTAFA